MSRERGAGERHEVTRSLETTMIKLLVGLKDGWLRLEVDLNECSLLFPVLHGSVYAVVEKIEIKK